jgi:hypothetical protein
VIASDLLGRHHGRYRQQRHPRPDGRFGLVDQLPWPIQWLSDNGSPYTASDTRALARLIGLVPLTTPIESPQSNWHGGAFVKTCKRDYAQLRPRPDAARVRALCGPYHSELSADGTGSSPSAARSAETRSIWLDASMAVTNRNNRILFGYSTTTTPGDQLFDLMWVAVTAPSNHEIICNR